MGSGIAKQVSTKRIGRGFNSATWTSEVSLHVEGSRVPSSLGCSPAQSRTIVTEVEVNRINIGTVHVTAQRRAMSGAEHTGIRVPVESILNQLICIITRLHEHRFENQNVPPIASRRPLIRKTSRNRTTRRS